MSDIKLIAMDLDGTLTQHKTPLTHEARAALDALDKKYRLVMAGAGMARRIFSQMGQYPIDIVGNYGMQWGLYNETTRQIDIVRDEILPFDRELIISRIDELREIYGYTDYAGDTAEFHSSGCVTFPLLGTKADPAQKLSFDPDRKKRRAFYGEVVKAFPEYNVFVGGSSSFDMAPKPFDKYYALSQYCAERNIDRKNVLYIGDDYGLGGNDEPVYRSDIPFLTIDDYRDFPRLVQPLL